MDDEEQDDAERDFEPVDKWDRQREDAENPQELGGKRDEH